MDKARTTKTKVADAKTHPDDTIPTRAGRWGKKWPGDDRASWRIKQEANDAPAVTKTEEITEK